MSGGTTKTSRDGIGITTARTYLTYLFVFLSYVSYLRAACLLHDSVPVPVLRLFGKRPNCTTRGSCPRFQTETLVTVCAIKKKDGEKMSKKKKEKEEANTAVSHSAMRTCWHTVPVRVVDCRCCTCNQEVVALGHLSVEITATPSKIPSTF